MLVRDAISHVARRIGLQENDPEIYNVLTLAEQEVWATGKWWGSVAEFYIRAHGNFFTMPPGYGHLVAINIDGYPTMKGSRYYQHHINGYGSHDCWTCRSILQDRVIDLGEYPLNTDFCRAFIGVGISRAEDARIEVIVSGENSENFDVYQEKVKSACDGEMETVYGHVLRPEVGAIVSTEFTWETVEKITKPITKGNVEVFAIFPGGAGTHDHVATIAPHMTESRLRRYQLPSTCKDWRTLHVLAKSDEPQQVVHPTQPLITPTLSALLNMSLAVDLRYNKQDLERSEQYRALAIRSLDEHLAEKRGDTAPTMEVAGVGIGTDYSIL